MALSQAHVICEPAKVHYGVAYGASMKNLIVQRIFTTSMTLLA